MHFYKEKIWMLSKAMVVCMSITLVSTGACAVGEVSTEDGLGGSGRAPMLAGHVQGSQGVGGGDTKKRVRIDGPLLERIRGSLKSVGNDPEGLWTLALNLGALIKSEQVRSCFGELIKGENAAAQGILGMSYFHLFPADVRAASFFEEGADGDDPSAQMFLGDCYRRGWKRKIKGWGEEVVEKDDDTALFLYARAFRQFYGNIDQGSAIACFRIGEMYDVGRGMIKDVEKAQSWFQEATKRFQGKGLSGLSAISEDDEGISDTLDRLREASKQDFDEVLLSAVDRIKDGIMDNLETIRQYSQDPSKTDIQQALKESTKLRLDNLKAQCEEDAGILENASDVSAWCREQEENLEKMVSGMATLSGESMQAG